MDYIHALANELQKLEELFTKYRKNSTKLIRKERLKRKKKKKARKLARFFKKGA